MNQNFITFSWATLVVVFLVIIAGSVVRATGSGMGCPDWPKCFGYLIPPNNEAKVQFQPDFHYKKDQMIIHGDELLKAKMDFTSSENFTETDWEVYEKHDYSIYNPVHTWTEYINRLFGALSGLFVLVLFGWSILLTLRKRLSFWIPVLAFFTLIFLGFQAWLGKVVVDSNLEGAKITAHLFGALLVVAFILLIIRFSSKKQLLFIHPSIQPFVWISLALLLVQMFLGAEFRVQVDEYLPENRFSKIFDSNAFKTHRSFAWLVLISTLLMLWKVKQKSSWKPVFSLVFLVLIAEIVFGVLLYYLEIPPVLQPLHLLFSCLLFTAFFWVAIAKSTKSFLRVIKK